MWEATLESEGVPQPVFDLCDVLDVKRTEDALDQLLLDRDDVRDPYRTRVAQPDRLPVLARLIARTGSSLVERLAADGTDDNVRDLSVERLDAHD